MPTMSRLLSRRVTTTPASTRGHGFTSLTTRPKIATTNRYVMCYYIIVYSSQYSRPPHFFVFHFANFACPEANAAADEKDTNLHWALWRPALEAWMKNFFLMIMQDQSRQFPLTLSRPVYNSMSEAEIDRDRKRINMQPQLLIDDRFFQRGGCVHGEELNYVFGYPLLRQDQRVQDKNGAGGGSGRGRSGFSSSTSSSASAMASESFSRNEANLGFSIIQFWANFAATG